MKIILSPAKKLNFTTPLSSAYSRFNATRSPVLFRQKTQRLLQSLNALTVGELQKLLSLSPSLAELNHQRFKNFSKQTTPSRSALFAFNGDVYEGLAAAKLSEEALAYLQKHAFILSGLYGLLRPFTPIKPYRLEMGKNLPSGQSLYAYWGNSIAKKITAELEDGGLILNLASHEYFQSVKPHLPYVQAPAKNKKNESNRLPIEKTGSTSAIKVVSPIFKDISAKSRSEKGAKTAKNYKVISFYAKKARGLFARFVAESMTKKTNAAPPMPLFRKFNLENYRFAHAEKEYWEGKQPIEHTALVFLRDELPEMNSL